MKTTDFILFTLLFPIMLPAHAQFDYTTNADNTLTIIGYSGPGGDVTIPSTIDGLPVTDIAQLPAGFVLRERLPMRHAPAIK
jgi:hypothetical protein